jgi:hypothetical protein
MRLAIGFCLYNPFRRVFGELCNGKWTFRMEYVTELAPEATKYIRWIDLWEVEPRTPKSVTPG